MTWGDAGYAFDEGVELAEAGDPVVLFPVVVDDEMAVYITPVKVKTDVDDLLFDDDPDVRAGALLGLMAAVKRNVRRGGLEVLL